MSMRMAHNRAAQARSLYPHPGGSKPTIILPHFRRRSMSCLPLRRMILRCAALLLPLALSGCIREAVEGDTIHVGYEWWVTAGWMVGGLVATPLGWLLRKTWGRIGWGLLIGGPIMLVFAAPTAWMTQAEVSPEGFKIATGFFGTTRHEGRFDDITMLRQTSEEKRGRRGRKTTSHYLNYDRKSGQPEKFSLGNDVQFRAAELIVAIADEQGIPFVDQSTP